MSRADAQENYTIHAGDIEIVVLWYPQPHQCWRIEVRGYDLDGDTTLACTCAKV